MKFGLRYCNIGRYSDGAATIELAQAAEEAGLGGGFDITVGEEEGPFICDLEYGPFLSAFPEAPHTALADAIRTSLTVFQTQVQAGWLTTGNIGDGIGLKFRSRSDLRLRLVAVLAFYWALCCGFVVAW